MHRRSSGRPGSFRGTGRAASVLKRASVDPRAHAAEQTELPAPVLRCRTQASRNDQVPAWRRHCFSCGLSGGARGSGPLAFKGEARQRRRRHARFRAPSASRSRSPGAWNQRQAGVCIRDRTLGSARAAHRRDRFLGKRSRGSRCQLVASRFCVPPKRKRRDHCRLGGESLLADPVDSRALLRQTSDSDRPLRLQDPQALQAVVFARGRLTAARRGSGSLRRPRRD